MNLSKEQLRSYWLDYARKYCNQEFKEGSLPPALELFLDSKVNSYRDNGNVQTEKLSDMSLTYFENELNAEERSILNTMRKLRSP